MSAALSIARIVPLAEFEPFVYEYLTGERRDDPPEGSLELSGGVLLDPCTSRFLQERLSHLEPELLVGKVLSRLVDEYAHLLARGAAEVRALDLSVNEARRLVSATSELVGPGVGRGIHAPVAESVQEELYFENLEDDEETPPPEAEWPAADCELLRKARALTPLGEAYLRDATYRILHSALRTRSMEEGVVACGLVKSVA